MEFDDFLDKDLIKNWIDRLSISTSKKSLLEEIRNNASLNRKKRQIKKIVKEKISNGLKKVEYLKRSKTGNDSFRLKFRDHYLKCYECWTPEHVWKVKVITESLIKNGIPFPRIILTSGRYVVSDWMEGKKLTNKELHNDDLLQRLAKYQASIHTCPYPRILEKNWEKDHYLMFIIVRLLVFGKKYFPTKELLEICKAVYELKPRLDLHITHPDFTLRNMILVKDKLIMIDNETLNVDQGYEYDILNAKKWFFWEDEKRQESYIQAYSKYNNLGILISKCRFWDLLWKIRMAGSEFQLNNPDRGKKIIENLQEELAKGVI